MNKFKDFLQKLTSSANEATQKIRQNPRFKNTLHALSEKSKDTFKKAKPLLEKSFAKMNQGIKNKDLRSVNLKNLNLNKALSFINSPTTRPLLHKSFAALLSITAAYQGGKIVALGLREQSTNVTRIKVKDIDTTSKFAVSELSKIKLQNPFRTDTEVKDKPILAKADCKTAEKKSSLPLKLVNTVVLQDEVKSIASVQVRSEREPQEFRVGDKISSMAEVFKINRLQLIIKNLQNGLCEYISSGLFDDVRSKTIAVLSPKKSNDYKKAMKAIDGIKNDGNKFTIAKSLLDEKLKDISSILTQARAIQIQNPDGTLSFKVTDIEPGGVFAFLGIQDQDIITSINGKPISGLNDVMNLFGKVKNLSQLKLGVNRGGQETELEYEINK